MTCILFLVRHAQSEANAGISTVRDDLAPGTPLSDRGRGQAAWLHEQVKDQGITALWASDLQRAVETAEIAIPHLRPGLTVQLRERGALTPGIEETAEETSVRIARALAEIAAEHAGERVLVVCHGFAMRAFLVGIGAATFDLLPTDSIGNVGWARLRCQEGRFMVEAMANYRHGGKTGAPG